MNCTAFRFYRLRAEEEERKRKQEEAEAEAHMAELDRQLKVCHVTGSDVICRFERRNKNNGPGCSKSRQPNPGLGRNFPVN